MIPTPLPPETPVKDLSLEHLTLRDFFAALASQGFLAQGNIGHASVAMQSYRVADLMMAQREQR